MSLRALLIALAVLPSCRKFDSLLNYPAAGVDNAQITKKEVKPTENKCVVLGNHNFCQESGEGGEFKIIGNKEMIKMDEEVVKTTFVDRIRTLLGKGAPTLEGGIDYGGGKALLVHSYGFTFYDGAKFCPTVHLEKIKGVNFGTEPSGKILVENEIRWAEYEAAKLCGTTH